MTIYKKILEKIPQILNSGENPEHCFENTLNFLKEAVEFEAAYVCYLNSGNAGIKYRKTAEKEEILLKKQRFCRLMKAQNPFDTVRSPCFLRVIPQLQGLSG